MGKKQIFLALFSMAQSRETLISHKTFKNVVKVKATVKILLTMLILIILIQTHIILMILILLILTTATNLLKSRVYASILIEHVITKLVNVGTRYVIIFVHKLVVNISYRQMDLAHMKNVCGDLNLKVHLRTVYITTTRCVALIQVTLLESNLNNIVKNIVNHSVIQNVLHIMVSLSTINSVI